MRRLLFAGFGVLGSLIMTYLLYVNSATIMGVGAIKLLETESVSFPYTIPGTDLVAENMVFYEGPFFENSSGEEVAGVVGLMITNSGMQGIVHAKVTVRQGEKELNFELTQLPALASVLVLEQSGQSCTQEPVEDCRAVMELEDTGWDPETYIALREPEQGCVEVTNIWQYPLQDLRLYYKTEYSDGPFFLGGITYEAWAGSLEPGATIRLCPPYYCSGTSRILRISFTE